jgi:hypothetical protein
MRSHGSLRGTPWPRHPGRETLEFHVHITAGYAAPEAIEIIGRLLLWASQLAHATKGNFNELSENVNAEIIIQLAIIYNSILSRLKLAVTGRNFFWGKSAYYVIILVFKSLQ